MKTITGNIITLAEKGEFDVICHGCNCFHTMGAGVAKAIKEKFPKAYEEDLKTKYGDKKKLGTCSIAKYDGFHIINCYTQYRYGTGIQIDYDALRKCCLWIKENYSGKRIGAVKIGCGLAGGNWSKVKSILEEILGEENLTIVELI